VPFRYVLDGILYVLRTGCQWKALPREYGSGSTCHRRFQQWIREGAFEKLWVKLLDRYDDIRGIKWKWLSLDSSSVKAPLGGTRRVKTLLIVRSYRRKEASSSYGPEGHSAICGGQRSSKRTRHQIIGRDSIDSIV
jgi:transposase